MELDEKSTLLKMDFSLETPEERTSKVKEIIEHTPSEKLTPAYLEKLSDYIIFAMDKQERKSKKILTENRLITVKKRETSFEGLVTKFENDEDSIYNLIANDKNIIFQPKISITEQDLAEIPQLKKLHDDILKLEEKAKAATGRQLYTLKKQIIQLRQDQYVIKNSYKKYIYCTNLIKSLNRMDLNEKITYDAETGKITSSCAVNLFSPKIISAILCNYSALKESSWEELNSDLRWLLLDLEGIIERNLKEQKPIFYDILIYKIDGLSNENIQIKIKELHDVTYSLEYISKVWRNSIPKIIAEGASAEYLVWYYTFAERGQWKRCSRCGQIKLAHKYFFSKNSTSKDGFYSVCKYCRSVKGKQEREKEVKN